MSVGESNKVDCLKESVVFLIKLCNLMAEFPHFLQSEQYMVDAIVPSRGATELKHAASGKREL